MKLTVSKDCIGVYLLDKRNHKTNIDRIAKAGYGGYKRPYNYRQIEKTESYILIWGDESPNELFEKIASLEIHHRNNIISMLFECFITFQPFKLYEYLNLVKKNDTIVYNLFLSTSAGQQLFKALEDKVPLEKRRTLYGYLFRKWENRNGFVMLIILFIILQMCS